VITLPLVSPVRYNQGANDRSWFAILIITMFLGALAGLAICMEDSGVVREPTTKSKLCACVIHVDSVPVPEDIVEGV